MQEKYVKSRSLAHNPLPAYGGHLPKLSKVHDLYQRFQSLLCGAFTHPASSVTHSIARVTSLTQRNEAPAGLAWREASTENIASQPIDFLGLLLYARGCHISALAKRQIFLRVSASALHFTTPLDSLVADLARCSAFIDAAV